MTRCSKAAVVLLEDEQAPPEHERQVHRKLGERIAQLMGIRFLEIDEAAMIDPSRFITFLPAPLSAMTASASWVFTHPTTFLAVW